MTFLVVVSILLANYAFALVASRRARRAVDPGLPAAFDVAGISNPGVTLQPAVRATRPRVLEPSEHPEVEHARRAELGASALAGFMGIGSLFATSLDDALRHAIERSAIAAIVAIGALAIGTFWTTRYVDAIVGPTRRAEVIGISLAGIIAGFGVLALAPRILG